MDQWWIQDFPLGGGGGALTHWGGGTNLQCIHFSVKTYAKTKEMDPVGGGGRWRRPPGSANVDSCTFSPSAFLFTKLTI